MSENAKKWYVVRAVSGQEPKVKSYIENELTRLGVESDVENVLVPMEKYFQMLRGKKVTKERPFFPGYVILEANLTGELAHAIKNIPGVVGFLSDKPGGEPVPLRKAEVNRMLGKVDDMSEMSETVVIPYLVGESIKVIDGPFNGFDGTVETVNQEKRKLKVIVKIFGRKTPLELSFSQVEKI